LMRLLGSFCKVRRSRIFIPVAFHPLLAETKVIREIVLIRTLRACLEKPNSSFQKIHMVAERSSTTICIIKIILN
jgi:hypothetical protein